MSIKALRKSKARNYIQSLNYFHSKIFLKCPIIRIHAAIESWKKFWKKKPSTNWLKNLEFFDKFLQEVHYSVLVLTLAAGRHEAEAWSSDHDSAAFDWRVSWRHWEHHRSYCGSEKKIDQQMIFCEVSPVTLPINEIMTSEVDEVNFNRSWRHRLMNFQWFWWI